MMAWTPKVHLHADPQAIEDFDVADAEEADQRARRQQVTCIGQYPRTGNGRPPRSLRCLSGDTPARLRRGSAAGPGRTLHWGKPQPPAA